jgi:hypothetical protein
MIFRTHNGASWGELPVRKWSGTAWAKLAGSGGGSAPAATTLTMPPAPNATVASLRPAGRTIATYTVSPTDTAADYATIGAAMEAAKAAQKSAGQQTSIAWNGDGKDLGPDYRVDIIVGPGTYNEVVGTGAWINLYGSTGNPADVKITSDAAGEGTLRVWGAFYMEGVTVESTPPASGTGQKYPLHLTAGPDTNSFVNCRFITTNSVAMGSGAAIGMDGDSGSYTLFYGCGITAIVGADWAANMHGFAANTTPLDVVFVDCTSNGKIVYDTLNSGLADKVYWIGGSTSGLTVIGTAAVTTVDPAATTGTVTATNVVSSDVWPLADGATSSRDDAYFYPSKIGTVHDQAPVVTDAAAMTVTANRVYYVPVPITHAIHATSAGCEVTTALGAINTYRAVQRGGTAPEPLFVDPATTALTTGIVVEDFYYFKDFYPGDVRVWVRLRFSDAAQVMGSAQLPGNTPCYYEDQPADSASYVPNLIQAPAGTPFPLALIRSKS